MKRNKNRKGEFVSCNFGLFATAHKDGPFPCVSFITYEMLHWFLQMAASRGMIAFCMGHIQIQTCLICVFINYRFTGRI